MKKHFHSKLNACMVCVFVVLYQDLNTYGEVSVRINDLIDREKKAC